MKEIKIAGLSKKECKMLDTMWNLESPQEFDDWIKTLSHNEVKMAITLKELLLAHCFDEVDDTHIANEYLEQFRL